jgi:hypothetical protein
VEGPKVFRCVILLRSLIGEWQQMVSNHKGTQHENTFQVQQETCIKAKIKSKTSNPHISYLNHNLIFFFQRHRERTGKEDKLVGRVKGMSIDCKYLLTFNIACLTQVI